MRLFVAVVAVSFLTACSKDEGKKESAPQAAPKEDLDQAAPGDSDMPNKQANCPTAVEGATTKIAYTDTDVQITIMAADRTALDEVLKRARHLEEVQGIGAEKIEHSGRGTGGGAGKCPVVMKDTKIRVAAAADRVVLMVSPMSEAGFEALKTETSRRQEAAGAPAPVPADLTGEAGWDGGVPGAAGSDMRKERMEKIRKEEKKKARQK